MYVIIVGCGQVGKELAYLMSKEKHDVAIIDKNSLVFNQLRSGFNGLTVEGDGFSEKTLIEAGIKKAEAFVALTNNDNVNILSAQVAKKIFNVPKVIARVYDPAKERNYQELGLEILGGNIFFATLIKNKLSFGHFNYLTLLGNGKVGIVEFKVKEKFHGKKIKEIQMFNNFFLISAIIKKNEEVILAFPEKKLEEGDTLIVTLPLDKIKKLEMFLET